MENKKLHWSSSHAESGCESDLSESDDNNYN